MRFARGSRCEYTVTDRKRAAAARRQRRQRESFPLLGALIGETQPSIDTLMAERVEQWDRTQQRTRDARAQNWRLARRELYAQPPPVRAALLAYWNGHRWLPGDPGYLLDVLHGFAHGRMVLVDGKVQPARVVISVSEATAAFGPAKPRAQGWIAPLVRSRPKELRAATEAAGAEERRERNEGRRIAPRHPLQRVGPRHAPAQGRGARGSGPALRAPLPALPGRDRRGGSWKRRIAPMTIHILHSGQTLPPPVHPTESAYSSAQANAEGWGIFDCGLLDDGTPHVELQRLDSPDDGEPPFPDDGAAWDHVLSTPARDRRCISTPCTWSTRLNAA